MKKIKVGVVGIGRIGRGHIKEITKYYPEQYEVIAVADHAPDRLENIPSLPENAKKYSSLDEMLKNPEIEMVTVGTRHPDHVPMSLKIMEAGKIAVDEKPVATSVAEMELLRKALEKHPGKLFFRHNRCFEPAFVKTKQLLDSGLIGEIQYIKLYRSIGYCRRNDWMTMPEFYGGLLTNWGPHLIDQALRFLDAPVVDLWADVRHVISIGAGDDMFKILMRGANGRLADVEVSGANAMPGREMEIIGSRGTLVYNGGEQIEVRHIDPAVELKPLKPHPENPPLEYGNFDEILYFTESKYELPKDISISYIWKSIYDEIVNGIPSPVTFEHAARVVKVTEEVYKKSGFEPIKRFFKK